MKPEKQTEKEKRNKVFQEIGARIAKSLFFWGMAAILASYAYTDLVGLAEYESGVEMSAAEEVPADIVEMSDAREVSGGAVEVPDAEEISGNAVTVSNAEVVSGGAEAVQDTDAASDRTEEAQGSDPGEVQKLESATADMAPADLTQKKIALTFDDGPHPVYTKKLLEGLAERHVEATFFVVGENIPGNEDLIARMKEEGHLIGNHTYDHVKICDMSGEEACEQVEKTSELVKEITGENTEFVRPPFGAWNKEMECSFTMIPVLWDVDPLDWTTKNSAAVVQKVLNSVEENDIILLHDCYDSSVEAALEIVDELLAQGYEFVTVDELILE